jgi:5-methylcytosine-specific restriction enzyme A
VPDGRSANRLGTPVSWKDESPVLIHWRIDRDAGPTDFAILPNEEITPAKFIEGAVRVVSVNAYERNPKARRACIDHYGYVCAVCEFDFATFYGEIGRGFTHVHHLRDLATIGEAYEVDPIRDLRPVCPNCHAMLHRHTPAMSIEALKAMLRRT